MPHPTPSIRTRPFALQPYVQYARRSNSEDCARAPVQLRVLSVIVTNYEIHALAAARAPVLDHLRLLRPRPVNKHLPNAKPIPAGAAEGRLKG